MKTAHLNALRALEATLRLGGFRAASAELNVTPAAVGQQIRSLENYLGKTLFDRHPTGATPTTQAAHTSIRLTAAFRELSEVLETLQPPVNTASVALTTTIAIAENWLPAQLPDFFRNQREVDLRIDTSRAVVDLHQRQFDFAIRHMDTPTADYRWVDMFPSYVGPVCTPQFAAQYALSPDTKSLDHVPLVHIDVPTTDPDWMDWPEWCQRVGMAAHPTDPIRSVTAQGGNVALANSGTALILTPLIDCFDALQTGQLVVPFGPQTVLQSAYAYRLIWPANRSLTKTQAAFRSWIADRAQMQCRAIDHWLGGKIPQHAKRAAPTDGPL